MKAHNNAKNTNDGNTPRRLARPDRLRLCAPAALLAFSCLPGAAARADVKITEEITVSSASNTPFAGGPSGAPASSSEAGSTPAPPAGSVQSVTIYYKGAMARRETAGGPTLLYDGEKNQVFVLNPADKTYSVFPTKDAFKWLNAAGTSAAQNGNKLPEGVHQETRVDIDKTGLKQNLLDLDTQKYTLAATLREVMESPQSGSGGGYGGGGQGGSGRGGGRRRGGGGFPGGGGQGGGYPDGGQGGRRGGAGRGLPATEMQGDLWLADDALLPAGNKSPLLPLLQGTVPDASILKSLYGKITKLKSLPLSTSVTTRASSAFGQGRAPLVTTTMQVRSISPQPLSDALFQVPADYQKSKPEAVLRQSAGPAAP